MFKLFRHKSSGVVASYPEHYIDHPVFGPDLEPYELGDEEYEEDKVVVNGTHELPPEQRTQIIAVPVDELKVDELKGLLKEKELPVSGNRDELIARIKDAHSSNEEN